MICLDCVKIRSGDVCEYCQQCRHLCGLKCKSRERLRKMDYIDKERSRIYCAPKPDPKVKISPSQTETHVPSELTCGNCPEKFIPKHPLQKYHDQECGRQVRNKNYRESRLTQGPPAMNN